MASTPKIFEQFFNFGNVRGGPGGSAPALATRAAPPQRILGGTPMCTPSLGENINSEHFRNFTISGIFGVSRNRTQALDSETLQKPLLVSHRAAEPCETLPKAGPGTGGLARQPIFPHVARPRTLAPAVPVAVLEGTIPSAGRNGPSPLCPRTRDG